MYLEKTSQNFTTVSQVSFYYDKHKIKITQYIPKIISFYLCKKNKNMFNALL